MILVFISRWICIICFTLLIRSDPCAVSDVCAVGFVFSSVGVVIVVIVVASAVWNCKFQLQTKIELNTIVYCVCMAIEPYRLFSKRKQFNDFAEIYDARLNGGNQLKVQQTARTHTHTHRIDDKWWTKRKKHKQLMIISSKTEKK